MIRMFYGTTWNYFTWTTTKLEGKQNIWETIEPSYLTLQIFNILSKIITWLNSGTA